MCVPGCISPTFISSSSSLYNRPHLICAHLFAARTQTPALGFGPCVLMRASVCRFQSPFDLLLFSFHICWCTNCPLVSFVCFETRWRQTQPVVFKASFNFGVGSVACGRDSKARPQTGLGVSDARTLTNELDSLPFSCGPAQSASKRHQLREDF